MDQQTEPQTSSPTHRPRRFLRASEDRFLGGVCGGLGRYFDVDPLLFRVGTVALTFIGGVVLIIYAALWLLVPTDDGSGQPSGPSPLRRLLGGADGRIRAGRVAAIAAFVLGGLLTALLLVVGAVWATASGGGAFIAGLVIALGLAAAAGALAGRRRAAWLLLPALLIAAPAGFTAAADVRFQGGFGDRQYSPTAVTALPAHGYKLAAGRLRVDLRGLPLSPGTTTEIPIQVGMGVATIIVPASVCVQSNTKVGAGYVDVLGDSEGGLDVRRGIGGAQGPAPRVLLRAKVGMGALEVVHRPQDAQFLDHGHGSYRPVAGASDNSACGGAAVA
jgi:phage shock protein PspC (stress-responsive transcriptional regulator)